MNITALQTALLAAEMPLGERISYGLQVFVIGYITVFASLAVLLGVLMIFKLIAYTIPNRKRKAAMQSALTATNAESEAAPEAQDASEEPDDTQLIAVITAAIEAYSAQSQTSTSLPFRVVSYKRVKNAGGWQGAENNSSF